MSDMAELAGYAEGYRHGWEDAKGKADRHQQHYRSCNCLADSDVCCDPACCRPVEGTEA